MQINRKKMVCINGVMKERRWNVGGCEISEVDEHKYLGFSVNADLSGSFKSMRDRLVDAKGVL